MTIETEHRGYRIHYSEHAQNWQCSDLGLEAPQLRDLRDKISKTLAKDAQCNVEAIMIGGLALVPTYREVTIVSITGDGYDGNPRCWISYVPDGWKRAKRVKESLANLAPKTDEVLAKIDATKALENIAERAWKQADQARAGIPRLTLADLKAARVETDEE